MSDTKFWESSRCTNVIVLHDWSLWKDVPRWFGGRVVDQTRYCDRCNRKEERYVGE